MSCPQRGVPPQSINYCMSYVDEQKLIPRLCTDNNQGEDERATFCASMGSEWIVGDTVGLGSCYYDTCQDQFPYTTHEPGYNNCCPNPTGAGQCCGAIGTMSYCVKQSFTGNPLNCCFNDMDSNLTALQAAVGSGNITTSEGASVVDEASQDGSCWSDNGRTFTCHPCQRDITSGVGSKSAVGQDCTSLQYQMNTYLGSYDCHDIAEKYCTGEDLAPGDISWIYRWMYPNGQPRRYEINNPSCYYALTRNLGVNENLVIANTIPGYCEPYPINADPDDLQWSQRLINKVVKKYQSAGYIIPSSPQSSGYNPFQEFLYKYVFCKFPLVSQQSLSAVCSQYTIDDVADNPQVTNFCGCYLPNDQYSEYVDNGVDKTCVPSCNRPSSVHVVSIDNELVPCEQDVCIIDDLTIRIANSTTGNININQVCSNCTGSCSCVVSDNIINIEGSNTGNININESCSSVTPVSAYTPGATGTNSYVVLLILGALVLIIVLVIACVLLCLSVSDD